MATRYVGPGGNDGNSGLTWVLRKLTLNGVEDTPVVANDLVYVGPGVYREMLTVDVSGGAGTEIVYVGDVTGEHTDQVGGIVRITGSDNDQAAARANCITAAAKDYRIFRGFEMDISSNVLISVTGNPNDWLIEDCVFQAGGNNVILFLGNAQADNIVRRCVFLAGDYNAGGIRFEATECLDASSLVENCLFLNGQGILIDDVGGIAIRNSTFWLQLRSVQILDALGGGFTAVTIENSILHSNTIVALIAINLGEIVEDYNTFYNSAADRTNVAVGGNSVTYPALFLPPILHSGVAQASGFKFPWWFSELSEWSQIRAITGNAEPTEDLRGIARPVTAAKNSWGPIQFPDMERETGTTHGGSASLCLHDAGRHQIFVPVTNTSTTISVYVYREANYAGNNPQMIVKQPGQADDVTTDAAAASQWNLLTTTLTPAADPPYVVVELVSRNTNGANDEVFFDDLVVS